MKTFGNAPTMKKLRLLPTPQARDEKNGSRMEDKRIQRKIQQQWSFGLNDLAAMEILPLPTGKKVEQNNGKVSQLNPLFVAEMMGFPTNWTLLPFLDGEKSR
jgi:hypothetical protein